MTKAQKNESNPYEQSKHTVRLIKPNFEAGYHFKFNLLVPINVKIIGKRGTKPVFTKYDIGEIKSELIKNFEGVTYSAARGDWIENRTGEIVVNNHARFEIYTKRNDRAVDYFKELRERLQLHKDEKIIMIEQTEVTFIPRPVTKVRHLLRTIKELKEKVKYLEARK